MRIHLGISTCPNDTFALHAVLERKVDLRGLDFDVELLDVEELNQRLFAGHFDVSKASFHAALYLTDQVGVLSSGSALGFGVGPLLLAARADTHPSQRIVRPDGHSHPARVLCPGEYTTAALLYQLFHPSEGEIQHIVFSEIMPALMQRRADFGVCIHEGRFTYRENGLALVEDLGHVWEQQMGCPLPLGGIVARHQLGPDVIQRIRSVLSDSIRYGLAHRQETTRTMSRYAQEFTEDVLFAHVDLYVNQWTVELGEQGREALITMHERAVQVNLLPPSSTPLIVY